MDGLMPLEVGGGEGGGSSPTKIVRKSHTISNTNDEGEYDNAFGGAGGAGTASSSPRGLAPVPPAVVGGSSPSSNEMGRFNEGGEEEAVAAEGEEMDGVADGDDDEEEGVADDETESIDLEEMDPELADRFDQELDLADKALALFHANSASSSA